MMDSFFLTAADGTNFVQGSYQPGLVFLSILVPVCLSLMALHTAHIALSTQSRSYRHVAIGMGGIALGGGIWAMHFIGMLAFTLPAPVIYDKALTLLSLLPGWAASWLALYILSRRALPRSLLAVSGLLMGAGIGLMHYTGMMAMITPLTMRYDPALFALSIGVAAGLATLALWIRFGLQQTRLNKRLCFVLSGIIMGVAIAGMHYTGMAAVRFLGESGLADHTIRVDAAYGALALSSLTITVGVLVAALNGLIHTRELYREMELSKSRLRAIVDTAVDAIITMDGHGTVQEFSPSAERLFGYAAAEVVGRNVNMLMPEPYHSEHDGYLRRYHATGEAHIIGTGREVIGLRKDGTQMPVRLAVGRVDLSGNDRLYVGMLTDISDRQALEASLRDAAQRAELAAAAKTRFLANMSHEIRTPMNSIIGFAELLQQTDLTKTQRNYLNTIGQSSRTLLRLINDILDTTKLEHGRMELESRDFSLKALAHQIESSLRLGAQSKALSLSTHYPDTMPEYFRGDTLRLLQILTNLVGNAIKFTETGGVELHFAYEHGTVHAQIRDTGIGMSPDQIRAIFDPFTQADASISRRFGGTGLGTTIARQLVQSMGGRIEVQSAPGQGSTFHIWLPLPPGKAPAQESAAEAPAALPPLRVLIADDIDLNLELLQLTLQAQGHQVTPARDGREAVEKFMAGAFDVVLMDVHMPDTDGLQATRLIRQHERQHDLRPTPIVALTASVMAHDREQASLAGMNGFAVKPLDAPRLFAEIARVTTGSPTAAAAAAETVAAGTTAPVRPDTAAPVPAIDWARGIKLWDGRERLAERILGFLDQAAAQYPLPSPDDPAADPGALHFSLHGLRGAAGNLALSALSRCAGDLEEHARAGRPQAAQARIPQLLALMDAARREARAAIASAAPQADASPPQAVPPGNLPDIMAALRAVLVRHELDDAALDAVCDGLSARGRHARSQALREAIDSFDFDRAGALLGAWLDEETPA
ncbi:MHYT domain-containing protein [uncultured Castellaniella sp.]|uniref:MHYT domain-containing protein n=1 Tax=uncultured Castellaniella sp. TaxID=647907 RepID=UPI002626F697|nr:MHYT domain-containing protein [uncultured Castellaniella sp.]